MALTALLMAEETEEVIRHLLLRHEISISKPWTCHTGHGDQQTIYISFHQHNLEVKTQALIWTAEMPPKQRTPGTASSWRVARRLTQPKHVQCMLYSKDEYVDPRIRDCRRVLPQNNLPNGVPKRWNCSCDIYADDVGRTNVIHRCTNLMHKTWQDAHRLTMP